MRAYQIHKRLKGFRDEESGAIAVVVALLLVVFLGMGALAFDVGRMYWVQNELKKAAEAGALAGARSLVPYVQDADGKWKPDWAKVQNAVNNIFTKNSADGKPLTNCEVSSGYWDLANPSLPLKPKGSALLKTYVPAVQVVVRKDSQDNGGPLDMFFARIFGKNTADISAQAVAIISYPIGKGGLSPLAVWKQTVEDYPKDQPNPPLLVIGWGEDDGSWTSFLSTNNSAKFTKSLIIEGSSDIIHVGDDIYIQPGAEAVEYGLMGDYHAGQTVYIPVVADNPVDFQKEWTEVEGFIGFHIVEVNQGGKYLAGYLDPNYVINDGELGSLINGEKPVGNYSGPYLTN